jgi:1,4-dihydroxy-2-naphthoate octaprenyltransferase/chlorophyll synthase
VPDALPRTFAGRWLHALKLASWPKLLVPCALGQALGVHETAGEISWGGLAAGVAFTVLDLVFVVLLNDWGDRDVDRIKRRMFPHGCSPKTIPDAILPPHHLLAAGLCAGVLALAVAGASSIALGRPLLLPAALFCLAMFWAYTLPPVRLNYRGGGEVLEMLGVGIALPWLNAYAQSGALVPAGSAQVLPGFALLALASALASGLSDEVSDRRGGKRTFTTMLGNPMTRRFAEACTLGAAITWAISAFFSDVEMMVALIAASGYVWDSASAMRKESTSAVTNAFAAQTAYKAILHRGIVRGTLLASAALVALTLLWGR